MGSFRVGEGVRQGAPFRRKSFLESKLRLNDFPAAMGSFRAGAGDLHGSADFAGDGQDPGF